jgi:hypothetical protein
MPTVGTVARLMVELSAAGVAETGAAVRGVGTSAESSTAKLGLMKRFMGSFLGQQLIFGLISKAIQVISTNIQDIGTKTNAWDQDLAQLNAVLASTHGQAGMTAQAAIELADAMSQVTLYNNDAVLSTENLLLTFTAITKDIFPAATKVTLDMATALKEDTKSAAIQLGKALQDPVLGMTALRRVGVNFSKDQIEVVKQMVATGHTAQAQQLILTELNKEFGGSAKAAGTTMAGALQILNNQIDISKEAIGNALIPVLAGLFGKIAPLATQLGTALPNALHTAGTFLVTYVKQPVIDVKNVVGDLFGALGTLAGAFIGASGGGDSLHKTTADVHTALAQVGDVIKAITPGIGAVGGAIGTLVKALVGITTWAVQHKPVLTFLGIFFGVILVDALYSMAAAAIVANLALLPEELIFLGIVAAIALVGVAIYELISHWGDIVTFLGNFAGAVGNFIGNILGAVGDFADTLIDLYTWPYRTLWDHVGPFITGFVKFIANFFGNLIGIVVRWDSLILGLFLFPFRVAWAFLSPLLGFIMGKLGDFFGMVLGKIGELGGVIAGFIGGAIGGLLGAFGWVKEKLGDLAGVLGGFLGGAFKQFGDAWNGLGTLIANIWPGVQTALKNGLDIVIGVLNNFIEFIDRIQIHIPSISVAGVSTPGFDWNGLGIPAIPLLAQGGTAVTSGWATVGEQGPEQIYLPAGASVLPLGMAPARDVASAKGRGSGGGDTHYHVHVNASQATAGEVMQRMRKQELLHRGLVR